MSPSQRVLPYATLAWIFTLCCLGLQRFGVGAEQWGAGPDADRPDLARSAANNSFLLALTLVLGPILLACLAAVARNRAATITFSVIAVAVFIPATSLIFGQA